MRRLAPDEVASLAAAGSHGPARLPGLDPRYAAGVVAGYDGWPGGPARIHRPGASVAYDLGIEDGRAAAALTRSGVA